MFYVFIIAYASDNFTDVLKGTNKTSANFLKNLLHKYTITESVQSQQVNLLVK